MSGRGRPRKAQIGSVVAFNNGHGVVVAYRKSKKFGRYKVVRTDPLGRHPYGQAIWLDTTEFTTTERTSKTPVRVYRGNQRIGGTEMRGCACQCCVHVRGVEPEPEE